MFNAASKKQAKLKLLIDGTSGSGKTHTMLRILRGIGGKIAVIDSENHSVEKKPNELLQGIDVANITNRSIDNYIKCIKYAQDNGYTALGIDSMSHPWQELLEEIDATANAKFGGNTFRAWSAGTPKQRGFIDAIIFSDLHIIATGRVKTEWAVESNDKGKMQPRKVGLDVVQGKGLEYEFDLWARMSDNTMTILKDRFDIGIQGKFFDKPGEEFGHMLMKYLSDGDEAESHAKQEAKQDSAKKSQSATSKISDSARSDMIEMMDEMSWSLRRRELAFQRAEVVGEKIALDGIAKEYEKFCDMKAKNVSNRKNAKEEDVF